MEIKSRTSWPSASTREHTWRVSGEMADFLGKHRASQLDGSSYNSTVPALIAGLEPDAHLSTTTLRAASDALQELVYFAERSSQLPPFMSAVMLRSESASSSQIENLSTSTRRIAEAELGLEVPQNARLVSANTAAMSRALDNQETVTISRLLEVHSTLMKDAPGVAAGEYRTVPIWIGGSNFAPVNAKFVGPMPELIGPALSDLVDFLGTSASSALSVAAVAHAQFETIHPFEDGNGRTGRALLHMILTDRGYGSRSPVPLSAGLLTRDSRSYFEALDAYRQGDIDAITLVVAQAAQEASALGLRLANDVQMLRAEWAEPISARADSALWKVMDTLFANPVTSIPHLRGQLGISAHAAMRALQKLAEAGVLEQSVRDRRQKTWRAPAVLDLLDDFAAGLERR